MVNKDWSRTTAIAARIAIQNADILQIVPVLASPVVASDVLHALVPSGLQVGIEVVVVVTGVHPTTFYGLLRSPVLLDSFSFLFSEGRILCPLPRHPLPLKLTANLGIGVGHQASPCFTALTCRSISLLLPWYSWSPITPPSALRIGRPRSSLTTPFSQLLRERAGGMLLRRDGIADGENWMPWMRHPKHSSPCDPSWRFLMATARAPRPSCGSG